jgi:hypothetical protein
VEQTKLLSEALDLVKALDMELPEGKQGSRKKAAALTIVGFMWDKDPSIQKIWPDRDVFITAFSQAVDSAVTLLKSLYQTKVG